MKRHLLAVIGAAMVVILPVQGRICLPTINNLNAASQGEFHAALRYEAFAKRADQEGHWQAARLFRALAQAELIHLGRHKSAVLALHGKFKCAAPAEVKVDVTRENLRTALNSESYEGHTQYPEFIQQAREDGIPEAVRLLTQIQRTEAKHAKLCREALDNVGQPFELPYHVCHSCGYTTTHVLGRICPNCREPADSFVAIK